MIDENGEEIKTSRVRGYWNTAKYLTVIEGESLTVEVPPFETDVNEIVSRFERTGYLPTSDRVPQYGDVTNLQVDLTQALAEAQQTLNIADQFAQSWEPVQEPIPESTHLPTNPTKTENSP